MDEEYVKKLERRIHNQRVALRENWMIIEERNKHRRTNTTPLWRDFCWRLRKENNRLREDIEKLTNG